MATATPFLHGVELVDVDAGPRPIEGAASSVIGLVGTAFDGEVSKPVLIAGSRREAEVFGKEGTIPPALQAIFDQIGAAVVVVNVLDPDTHKTTESAKNYTFGSDDTVQLDHRHVSEVKVFTTASGQTAYTEDTDYSVDEETGVVTRLSGGTIPAAASKRIGYKWLDKSKVTAANITAGAEKLLDAESTAGLRPKILIAPGFTSQVTRTGAQITAAPVTSALEPVATKLRAVIVADGPNTTDAEAIAYRGLLNSRRIFVVDPQVKVFDAATNLTVAQPASAYVAGVIARSDAEQGFWFSPSNRVIRGIVGTARPVDLRLGDASSRANLLNAAEVATIVNQNGYRLWGNRTSSSDPRWAFLSVVRVADQINEALWRSHLWAVDRALTKTYIEEVRESVNAYLRGLTGQGAILGGRCWADPELNDKAAISSGKVYFDFDFTPPYPAEHITFRARLVNDYIKEIF